jgi:serine phosphatase RsbU (regulator of sigma subunit)
MKTAKISIGIIIVWIILLAAYSNSVAQIPIELVVNPKTHGIGKHISYLEDKTKTLTIDKIQDSSYQKQFQSWHQETVNFGFSQSDFWIKFQIRKDAKDKHEWFFILSYPQLDYFEFYEPISATNFSKTVHGDLVPFAQRPIPHHDFVIQLNPPDEQIVTYYLKVNSEGSLQLPMHIEQREHFLLKDSENQIGYGLYYGIMLTMILYNLFVFFSLRDVNYIYYVLSIFSSTWFFASVSGYGYQHIWGAYPQFNNPFTATPMSLWVIFSSIFTINFIDVKRYIPRLSRLLYLGIFVGIIAVILTWTAPYRIAVKVASVAVALNVIFILVCGLASLFSRNKSARYFVLAWSLFLVATFLIVLSRAGIIPTNFITTHGVEFGSVLEVLLLSFALSDRYKLIKIENESIQAENLRVQKEANETLEQKVKERTQELLETNEEINQVNEEMKTTLFTVQQQKEEIEKKNFDITSSINYARRIQNALLPPLKEIKAAFPNSFILFKPKDIVSGDFYWFAELRNNVTERKQIFAVVDCTGHGVPGAMMSMIGTNLLNEIVSLQGITQAHKILEALNIGVQTSLSQSQNENQDGMAISLLVINQEQKTVEFSGAKHSLIYIQKIDNEPQMTILKGNKNTIGGDMQHENEPFTTTIIDISTNTTFYSYSDGYPDQFGGVKNKKFMASQLNQLLFENHKLPMEMQKTLLDKTVEDWMFIGRQKQIDDILVVGIKL